MPEYGFYVDTSWPPDEDAETRVKMLEDQFWRWLDDNNLTPTSVGEWQQGGSPYGEGWWRYGRAYEVADA